jgi:hypothetical protein
MFLMLCCLLVSSPRCRYDAEVTHLFLLNRRREISVGKKVVVYDLH